jgi:hypothetical protein
MTEDNIRIEVLVSIQRALWGMIYPEIRAIAVGWEGLKKLKVIYYLDREPKEEDFENISEVTGEVCGDINFSEVEEKCIFTKLNTNQLDNLKSWVYIRWENDDDIG